MGQHGLPQVLPDPEAQPTCAPPSKNWRFQQHGKRLSPYIPASPGGGSPPPAAKQKPTSAKNIPQKFCTRFRSSRAPFLSPARPQDEDTPLSADLSHSEGFLEALGLDEGGPKSHTMGYLHVTLAWMRQWSWETRARIVMEKTHFWPRLVEPLPWLQPPAGAEPPAKAWQHCWLNFLVAHQDWRGLAAWVRSLPFSPQTDSVDAFGKSCVDLEKLEHRGLRFCTSYSREVLLQQLGRRGIFCSGDTQDFHALLCRLTLCGKLFGDGMSLEPPKGREVTLASKLPSSDSDEGSLPLDHLLPVGTVSPFHCFFINYCIDNDPRLYLQRYNLATTMSTLKELHIQQSQRSWAPLLLVGRLGNPHLFAASLHHAASVYPSSDTSFTRFVKEDAEGVPFMPLGALADSRPIAFLATLMFAPVACALELLKLDKDCPWAVSKQTLQKAVAAYPALSEAFLSNRIEDETKETPAGSDKYGRSLVEAVAEACSCQGKTENRMMPQEVLPQLEMQGAAGTGGERHMTVEEMATFKGDVALSTLLSDVASFDVVQVLDRLCIFEECEVLNLAQLADTDEHFPDELEESYFLSQGRAMMAYHVLMTNCKRQLKAGEELRFPLALAAEDARRLRKAAKSVALHNLLNEGVVSSAVCLLELCGLETEKLRVDVEAAKRIYSHTVHQSRSAGEDRQRAAAASVIQLFMSFPDTEDASASAAAEAAISSPHLLNALRMLEESTWALDPHPSAPTASSIQALGYDLPWHLVALFCRVHSLPRSLTLLHELARNNDWVMFLYESDLQQCPAETVLDIVGGYFTEVPLQNHLQILANSIAAQEQGQQEQQGQQGQQGQGRREERGRSGKVDDSSVPADAISFLERSRSLRSTGSSMSLGLLGHALLHRKARLAVVASAFSDVTYLQCMAVWLTVNAERLRDNQVPDAVVAPLPSPAASPGEVAAQIASLCRQRHAFSLVLRALKIFDPENPLIDFVCFHRAFVQCRFKSCREHLRRFVGRRQESGTSCALDFSPHVERLSEDMVWYLLDGFPRSRMMLLSVLDEAGFSPRFSLLFSAYRTGLDVDFRVPSTELLSTTWNDCPLHEEKAVWDLPEAATDIEEDVLRSQRMGVAGDTVVFEEVTGMIVEFRQGAWWNVLAERIQLWHKCFSAFMRQSPPVGSANFFLDITAKLEPDLFAREQLVLLSIARELLLIQHSTAQVTSSHEDHLEQLKVSLLLILTGTAPDLTPDLELCPLAPFKRRQAAMPLLVQAPGTWAGWRHLCSAGDTGKPALKADPVTRMRASRRSPVASVILGMVAGSAIKQRSRAAGSGDSRRRALITGANSGIGLATAVDLASKGWEVVPLCRSKEKARETKEDIADLVPEAVIGEVDVPCDLADLPSVARCAKALSRSTGQFDALIFNAGIDGAPLERTPQGQELHFAVNHLGHFALWMGLKSCLAEKVRVVTVTSSAALDAELDLDDLDWKRRDYGRHEAYAASKACNVLFAEELARRFHAKGSFASANSIDPGPTATQIVRYSLPERALQRRDMDPAQLARQARLFGLKTPSQAAEGIVWLADSAEAGKLPDGQWWSAPGTLFPAPTLSWHTEALAEELWKRSEALVKDYVEDLSYKTMCTLVHRIPDQVNALPLYGMEGALMTSARANSSFGTGPSAKEGQGGSVLDAQQKGPRGELIPFLETGISSLINRDELLLADELASGFGYESSDQKLAAALSSIAGGKHLEAVRRLKSQQSPLEPSDSALTAAEQGDAEPLLNELGSHCSDRIALYCRRCRVFYSVSRNIGMDYQEVEKVEPTKLLSLLLSPQPYCADIELCRNLITGFPRLDAVAVAEVLLDSFIESMLSQGVMRWAEEKLDEFVSLLSPSQELLGHAALQRIPSFRELVKTEHGSVTVPSQVLDPETEVEVLIMAYHSYVQGCRERSVSELLRLLQARAEFYVARGHFHLLVRLLVAIPEYHAMEYLFGHLVRHGELHALLAEGRRRGQDATKCGQHIALAVALIRYLQVNFPLDLEMLVQVHCSFGLEAELAELLETKAGQVALRLGRKWTDICSEDGEEQLLLCLSMYLQCARLFLKGKRHQRHLVANELAALICLQLKAVQIHLAASLHEQNAATAGQESFDWAAVPTDGPESLANALVDATGRQKGWGEQQAVDGAENGTGCGPEVEDSCMDKDSSTVPAHSDGDVPGAGKGLLSAPRQSQEQSQVLPPALGPAGDVFVVINLMPSEVEVFAEYHQDFIATLEVVSAYRHSCGDGLFKVWPRALYRQVVLLGNRLYLQLFLQHLPLSKEWLQAIVQLYLDEPCPEQFSSRMLRMKQFLREGVTNLETRHQLARQLGPGFTDVAIETASLVYMA
ncbi:Wwox [Symbiodinium sp. KB8]|nr:Wwox [Symbiodinium sp. KB8]